MKFLQISLKVFGHINIKKNWVYKKTKIVNVIIIKEKFLKIKRIIKLYDNKNMYNINILTLF